MGNAGLMDDIGIWHVLRAYQERYITLSQMPFVKLIIIFKNFGLSAGTSLEHPHSQLVATPIVPNLIRIKYEVAIRHYDNTGRCLYSDLLERELKITKRVVMQTEKFVAFHPFASHQPFEVWIMPKTYQASFGNVLVGDLRDLAHILRIVLLKLYLGLSNPDFNYVIETAPVGDENKNYYLWHLRIIPRLVEVAGFDIGSGININTALPEETAKFMRELEVE